MTILAPRHRLSTLTIALLSLCTIASACSDDSVHPAPYDAGVTKPDATLPDGAAPDTNVAPDVTADNDATPDVAPDHADVASDKIADAVSEDGPAACACSSDDAQVSKGTTDLACFCAGSSLCRPYDEVMRCGGTDYTFETYSNCNYVSVRFERTLFKRIHVFDKTTHARVGFYISDDVASHRCGTSQVFILQGGVDPAAQGCTVANRVTCTEDGGRPDLDGGGPDADGGALPDADGAVPDADGGQSDVDGSASDGTGDSGGDANSDSPG